jgi:uncharacterized protein YfkK (UPF0435 family)
MCDKKQAQQEQQESGNILQELKDKLHQLNSAMIKENCVFFEDYRQGVLSLDDAVLLATDRENFITSEVKRIVDDWAQFHAR